MIRKILALVMACTVLMSCPVFAESLSRGEAEALMNSADAAIQGCKQAVDTAIYSENNAQAEVDWAKRRYEEAREAAAKYTRPEGMDKKKADDEKKMLKKEAEKAEEYLDYCKKLYKDSVKDRRDAERNLDQAYYDYNSAKTAYDNAR